MSAAGRALSKALDTPGDWAIRLDLILSHKPSGVEFWIGTGPFFFDGYVKYQLGGAGSIGLIERHWLYFKARKIVKANRHNSGADLVARLKASQK